MKHKLNENGLDSIAGGRDNSLDQKGPKLEYAEGKKYRRINLSQPQLFFPDGSSCLLFYSEKGPYAVVRSGKLLSRKDGGGSMERISRLKNDKVISDIKEIYSYKGITF